MALDISEIGTSRIGYDPNQRVAARNSRAYAKLADLQYDTAKKKQEEDTTIQEVFLKHVKDDGQFDREGIKKDLRKVAPHRVNEIENDWATTDLKRTQADKAFDMQDPLLRAQQLKNAEDELDVMNRLLRPVLEAPEDQKEMAFQAMKSTAVSKYKIDPKMFPETYDKDDIDRLDKATQTTTQWKDSKKEQVKEDRKAAWLAVAPDFKQRVIEAATDPEAKAALIFDVATKWSDVPEAMEAISSPLRVPPQETPAGIRQESKDDFNQKITLRREFRKDIPDFFKIKDQIVKLNKSTEILKNATPEERDRKRRALQDIIMFTFSKFEDPTSVVMPGEFARLMINQGDIGSRVLSAVRNKLTGGLPQLPDDALTAMADVANEVMGSVVESYSDVYDRYKADMRQVSGDAGANQELAPYVKFFEKQRGTDQPNKYSQYTQQNPLPITSKEQLNSIPRGKGTWIRYNSKGKLITQQW